MDLPHVWLWTMLLAFVLTWMIFHVNNQRKKKSMLKLAEAATEEIREGDADIIIVGAGVGGSALAYALAKVYMILRPYIAFVSHLYFYLRKHNKTIIFYITVHSLFSVI